MKQNSALLSIVLFLSIHSFAQIINVPADQPTIQEGINAAVNGNTVLVAEGTYYENINFKGKAITVASHFLIDHDTSHISKTIIDGSQNSNPDSGSVVYFVTGEDTTSIVCGFTITGGTGTHKPSGEIYELRVGGGIYCSSNARISNNKIVNNNIASSNMICMGGGIMATEGTLTDTIFVIIENNYICSNTVTTEGENLAGGGGIGFGCKGRIIKNDISFNNVIAQNVQGTGGGITMQFSKSVILSENTISHNKIVAQGSFVWGGHGGGLSTFFGWDLVIKGNRIFENVVDVAQKSNGAGVLLELLTGVIIFEQNEVFDNYYTGDGICHGGGVSIWKCDPIIRSNEIYNNKGYYGGGFYLGDSGSSPKMYNNIVHNNDSYIGGGIYVTNNHSNPCEPVIINNTICNNNATTVGGIYTKSSNTRLMNNIVWGNTAANGAQIHQVGGSLDIVYSNIQGGWEGEGNIDVDPMFADTLFNLSDSSYCAGNGISSISIQGKSYSSPSTDYFDNPRPNPIDEHIDIGAIESEFPQNPIVGIKEIAIELPSEFSLPQNYPNPFNPSTTIIYSIPSSVISNEVKQSQEITSVNSFPRNDDIYVLLKVYDVLGREVATLINQKQKLGNYEVTWDASNQPSGVYFYQINAGEFIYTRKMILLR